MIRPSVCAACASACSWESLPFSTSLATCRCVTSRAFSSPASTNLWSTSLSRTGTSADAITWAISPPMTPAPTTAALNTNMALTLAFASELPLGCQLVREAPQRAAAATPAACAGTTTAAPAGARSLGSGSDLERDPRLLEPRLECDASHTRERGVLELERLAEPRLVAGHLLDHPPARRPAARPTSAARRSAATRRPRLTTLPKPSIHEAQRCWSYHNCSASTARPGTTIDAFTGRATTEA